MSVEKTFPKAGKRWHFKEMGISGNSSIPSVLVNHLCKVYRNIFQSCTFIYNCFEDNVHIFISGRDLYYKYQPNPALLGHLSMDSLPTTWVLAHNSQLEFIQKIFIEHLLCVRHYFRGWGISCELHRQNCDFMKLEFWWGWQIIKIKSLKYGIY